MPDNGGLYMKNVVITGSTRGIGFATALEFLRAGCNVALSGRGESLAPNVLDLLTGYEEKYVYIQCNVQQKASLQKLWDAALAKWGQVDIWINNAGQNAPHAYAWETGEAYTDNVVRTNLIGMIYGSQVAAAKFFIPRMLRNTKNDVQIAWLTNAKAAWRFMTAGLRKDRLL
jgi:NAD(P)-dependent dehydrogenase (short-subunit alcohol dehydrogenase family)